MIDKIVALFATDEEVNHDLAVALMKGQGITLVDVFEHTPAYVDDNHNSISVNPLWSNEYDEKDICIGEFILTLYNNINTSIYDISGMIKYGVADGGMDACESNKYHLQLLKENKHLLGI